MITAGGFGRFLFCFLIHIPRAIVSYIAVMAGGTPCGKRGVNNRKRGGRGLLVFHVIC